jgi:hypothetical protein
MSIKRVYVFGNGMVMAFDQNGRQMPAYQGMVAIVAEKIIATGYHGPWIAAAWPRDWPLAYRAQAH